MLRTSIHPPASSSRIYRQSDECGMPYFFAALRGRRNSRRGQYHISPYFTINQWICPYMAHANGIFPFASASYMQKHPIGKPLHL